MVLSLARLYQEMLNTRNWNCRRHLILDSSCLRMHNLPESIYSGIPRLPICGQSAWPSNKPCQVPFSATSPLLDLNKTAAGGRGGGGWG